MYVAKGPVYCLENVCYFYLHWVVNSCLLASWRMSLLTVFVHFLQDDANILTERCYPIISNKQVLLRTEISYQALVEAERGSLEAVREIVWSTLHGIEQRVWVCLCLKVGIQDLVEAAWVFFTGSTTGKFSGLKIIGCGRNRLRFKID